MLTDEGRQITVAHDEVNGEIAGLPPLAQRGSIRPHLPQEGCEPESFFPCERCHTSSVPQEDPTVEHGHTPIVNEQRADIGRSAGSPHLRVPSTCEHRGGSSGTVTCLLQTNAP
ncbi:hypothetical protein GCM10023159_25510 [Brevibacterium yomogidense]